jgi:hypothetical protein
LYEGLKINIVGPSITTIKRNSAAIPHVPFTQNSNPLSTPKTTETVAMAVTQQLK